MAALLVLGGSGFFAGCGGSATTSGAKGAGGVAGAASGSGGVGGTMGVGGAVGSGGGGGVGGGTGAKGGAGGPGGAGGTAGTGGAVGAAGAGGAVGSGGASGSAGAGGAVGAGGGGGTSPGACGGESPCPGLDNCTLTLMPEGGACVRICSVGTLHRVTTTADVTALAALRCEVVSGGLYFDARLDNTVAFDTIREVDGDLALVHPNGMADLSGFANLESVTGALNMNYYSDGTDVLKVIEFPKLKSTTSFTVIGNGRGDTVHSVRLPVLQTLAQLAVNANPTLTEIQMPALTTVTTMFTVGLNDTLMSLAGFPALTSVPRAYVAYNPMLPECAVDAFIARVGATCSPCSYNDPNGVCN
jgi:hypothetical protein